MKNKSRIARNWLTAAWMGLGILQLALLTSCGRETDGEPSTDPSQVVTAEVVKATRKDLSNNLEIASEFEPFQEIDVHAKVSGYVQKLYVDWGSHVQRGRLLASLEVPELEDQIKQDQAALSRSEQNLTRAKEEVRRAESAHAVAHITFARLNGVAQTRPDLVAQEEIDVAQGKDSEDEAQVSAAKAALAAASEERDVARASLAKDETLYAYSRITAPFTGVVTKLYAYTGALLPAGTSTSTSGLPLLRLSQNDLLRLVIPLPESVVPKIHVGNPIQVRVSALNTAFAGTVVRFSGEVDEATRTMHTEVDVPNPDYVLVPGMYAYAEIPVDHKPGALAVPIQACAASTTPGQGRVLVVNAQGQIEQRHVTTGVQTAQNVEILSGIKEGELVVAGNQGRYRAGESVRPVKAALANPQGEQ
ncbi:MAG: efflux RND transporter periplasmic adaptor subunit [Acidobacteriia bacterium]|nr:efflux RND transporter periplasmic adaptor subunit [Terriglobia bacterium]